MKNVRTAIKRMSSAALLGVLALTPGVALATGGHGHHGGEGRHVIGYARVCLRVPAGGCFTPETKILMGDQVTTKKIYQIAKGEKVWNPTTKQAVPVAFLTAGPEKYPILEIGYGSTVVHVTIKHPMVVSADVSASNSAVGFALASLKNPDQAPLPFQMKRAKDITLNDSILGADGVFHKVDVLRILPVKEEQSVWNIRIDSSSLNPADHMLVADGVVTGDLQMQQKLDGE